MTSFLELSNKTRSLISQSAKLAESIDFYSSSQTISEQIAEFDKKQFMIVVAGEARRGKSTLLNALLNEAQPIFPVDVNVCTNVITVLSYGETEKIEVFIQDSKAKDFTRTEQITRSQIGDCVSEKGNPNNYKNIQMLNIQINNKLLSDKAVFVDTPGVGSLNVDHAVVTYGMLPQTDLLLFVSDADSGLTETELNFLQKAYKYCKSVIFPLTKKDLNAKYSEIVKDNRTKISKALNLDENEIKIVPISSAAKLRYLKTGNQTMYRNSNFTELEKEIWAAIARRKTDVLLLPFLLSAKSELLKIADCVAAQAQTLSAGKGAKELVEALNQELDSMKNLQQNSAEWRRDLALWFGELKENMLEKHSMLTDAVKNLINTYNDKLQTQLCKSENYSRLFNEVTEMLAHGTIDIRQAINNEADIISFKLYENLNFKPNINEELLKKIGFVPSNSAEVRFPEVSMGKKFVDISRCIPSASLAATAGSVVGGLACGIVGSIIGIVGGSLGIAAGGKIGATIGLGLGGVGGLGVGIAQGYKETLGGQNQLNLSAVNKAVSNYVSTALSSIGRGINNVISQLNVSITFSFEAELKKRAEAIKENTERLQKNIYIAKNEVPQKLALLKKQANTVNEALRLFAPLEDQIELVNKNQSQQKQYLTYTDANENANAQTQADTPANAEAEAVKYDYL